VDQVTKKKQDNTLFSTGKARWLLDNVQELDEGQRALLLAIAELDKDMGRGLTDEEHAALNKLAAETQGFDPMEIQAAVQKMVKGKAKRKPITKWPSNIVSKLKRSRKS
jgi:glycerol kinase